MGRLGIRPTGVERTFADDEIIVSKTDLNGRITYANRVFEHVSAYELDELMGAPHSIIRHPEMPRAIFSLLWERIQAGHEIFAYVLNLAKDGAHYWVYAHVTPTRDASGAIVGYHSNRRTPNRSALPAVESLHRRLLSVEARHTSRVEAAAAGRADLDRLLKEKGVVYDEFVWSL